MGDLIFPQRLGHSETATVLPSSRVRELWRSSVPHFPQRMFSTSIPQSEHVYLVNLLLPSLFRSVPTFILSRFARHNNAARTEPDHSAQMIRRPPCENIAGRTTPHLASRKIIEVQITPRPYFTERQTLIDDERGSYRVGQVTSPMRKPKYITCARI